MTVAAVFASVSISGCANRIIDFTALSSKNVDIPGVRGERVRGEDMASIVIFIPTGTPNIKEAVDDALEKGNGDLLIDGVIYNKMWYIPYVFGRFGFVVEGTVVNTKKAPPPVGERQALPMTKTVPPPAPLKVAVGVVVKRRTGSTRSDYSFLDKDYGDDFAEEGVVVDLECGEIRVMRLDGSALTHTDHEDEVAPVRLATPDECRRAGIEVGS